MSEEDALEKLELIKQWCEAYPVEIFTPVPPEQMERAHAILEEHGISLSAIHGLWARHLLSGIAKIAKEQS